MTEHHGQYGAPPPDVPGFGQVPDQPPVTSPPPYTPYAPAPYGQAPYGQAPQYPPPYGYPPPGYPAYPPLQSQGTNGFAIASMVLGIVWIYWIGSVLALVFGFIARKQIRERNQGGDGMAIAGIVLGFVGIAALIVVIIVAVAVTNDVNHVHVTIDNPP